MRWLLPVLIAAAVALAGPGRVEAQDQLTIGVGQFPASLHPTIDTMLAKSYVLAMTRRPITAHDPDWRLICMVCVELPTLENGGARLIETPDGKEGIAVTYRLRGDARWGDGTPLTTADVVFAWEVGRHPKSGVGAMEFYRSLYRIEVHDPHRLTLHFDKRTFAYNAVNTFEILPAHIERPIFEANPESYRNRTAYDTDPTNPGLYFGPYRIIEVRRGAHIVLARNPTWWGPEPYFERIVVRAVSKSAALEANLLSGAIDMIAGESGLTIDQAQAFERRHGDRYRVLYQPGLTYEHIDLNLENPILADIRVRRALIHAIDRAAISEHLFEGRQPVAHSMVNPLDWVHAEDLDGYAYDPGRASVLLDQAGWATIGGDGIRRNDAGAPLRLEIMTTAGDRTREMVQQVLQAQWRAVGVDMRIRNQPARVFFGETVTKRLFTGLALFAWISAPESVPRSTLHSAYVPSADNNWSGQNYTGFSNPEADDLLERIELTLEPEARARLWRRLQEIYIEEIPVIPLYFRANAFVLPKGLTGVTPTGHMGTSTLWVENWRYE